MSSSPARFFSRTASARSRSTPPAVPWAAASWAARARICRFASTSAASCRSSSPARSSPSSAGSSRTQEGVSEFWNKFAWIRNFGDSLRNGYSDPNAAYLICYALLILFFSFFWVATQFNAVRIADDLKRSNGYVPGIRPGLPTAEFLDLTMTRVTFIGAIGLILVAIIPSLLTKEGKIPFSIASFFGGTSLLIIVGVALDTMRQIESYLVMRSYDGFLKHGRIRGRNG